MASSSSRQPTVSFRGRCTQKQNRSFFLLPLLCHYFVQSHTWHSQWLGAHRPKQLGCCRVCLLPGIKDETEEEEEHSRGSVTPTDDNTTCSSSCVSAETSSESLLSSDERSASSDSWSITASASECSRRSLGDVKRESRRGLSEADLLRTATVSFSTSCDDDSHLEFLLKLVDSYSENLRVVGEEARRETHRQHASFREREDRIDELEKQAEIREDLKAWEARLVEQEARQTERERQHTEREAQQHALDREFEDRVLRRVRDALFQLRQWERRASAVIRPSTSTPSP